MMNITTDIDDIYFFSITFFFLTQIGQMDYRITIDPLSDSYLTTATSRLVLGRDPYLSLFFSTLSRWAVLRGALFCAVTI